ncbi:MAG: N-acetylmuramoyl-L-alanine amidase [Lachnospiraceae bacterium]|nr:N-acetylmuramoyl-L-alanine amidase [Lachnospiraceae bacterium]
MQNNRSIGNGRSSSNKSSNRSAHYRNGDSLSIIGEGDLSGIRSAGRNVRKPAGARNTINQKRRRKKRLMRRVCRDVIYISLFIAVFAAAFHLIRGFRSSGDDQMVEAQKITNVSMIEEVNVSEVYDVVLNLTDVDLTGYTIVVDPGHGGEDPGCMSGSIWECDINLAIAEKVAAFLERYGATVIMTRTEDEYLSLTDRAEIANEAEADYFVSLHCNSYDDDASISGLECYYYPGMEDGEAFAAAITEYMEENTEINVRKYEDSDLSVLRNTTMTAVLIEMGYMSSPTELRQLTSDSYQTELAQAVAEGIVFAISQE